MGKNWKPAKETVQLTPTEAPPSRIRRAPVPIVERQTAIRFRRSDQQELWFGATGVVLTAIVLTILVVAVGIVTVMRDRPPADVSFHQCYSGSANCVIDGDSIVVDRGKVEIAGIIAPKPVGAACSAEREKGIAAAIELQALLNRGAVALGAEVTEPSGRKAQKVAVDNDDVGERLLARGLARRTGDNTGWCGPDPAG